MSDNDKTKVQEESIKKQDEKEKENIKSNEKEDDLPEFIISW